jgi:DNA mismatch repair protein MutL
VRQLFFNVPARRKFLRSDETERAHIQHYLTLAALAYPEVGFTFTSDGRMIWQLPAIKSGSDSASRLAALHERFRALYSGDLKLLSVDFSTEFESQENAGPAPAAQVPPFRIWGFIGAPGVSRSTRQEQHLFVNRRPVDNRGLNYALMEGYHTSLMKGRYPVCCLFLESDPGEVDVNIHPSKREVKFHREREVRQFVADALRQTLLACHVPPPTAEGRAESLTSRGSSSEMSKEPATLETENVAAAGSELLHLPPETPRESVASLPSPAAARPSGSPVPAVLPPSSIRPPSTPSVPAGEPPSRLPASDVATANFETQGVPLLRIPLRLVGVIGRLYVVLESDRGLVLLDQHAAHERVLFEQMLRRVEQGEAPSQRLLLPETIELPPRDSQFLREQLETLSRLGVGLSEFGDRTFLLDALPPFVKVSDARRFVSELVDELKAAGQSVNAWRLGESTVAKTVCRHAVKANDALAGPELENLINDLRHCAMPYTCPHGRPTLIEMNFRELEKKFGRIQ